MTPHEIVEQWEVGDSIHDLAERAYSAGRADGVEEAARAVMDSTYVHGVQESLAAAKRGDQERAKHYAAWSFAANHAAESIRALSGATP